MENSAQSIAFTIAGTPEIKRAEEAARGLAAAIGAIGERQDLRSIFQVVIHSLEENLPIDFGCICLYQPERQALSIANVGARSLKIASGLELTERTLIPIEQNGISRCLEGHVVYAATVARMREFYRPRELQQMSVRMDLNKLIEQVVNLTRARWSDLPQRRGIVIDLQTQLADGLPSVMGIEGEIRDALTNLIFNGVDAMPDGGQLTLRTRVVAAHQGLHDRVHVEVTDTGIGMDEETKRRCLEPFFTTKGERGTGLGLAMVYGMAQRHHAEIEIDSRQNQGTTLRLTFPAAGAHAESKARVAFDESQQPLRILIVDDDPLLIQTLQSVLQADKHIVTVADGGQRGIDTFMQAQRSDAPFAVVITDLGMPHVDGRKVASAIKGASPNTPVILLTGWGSQFLDDNENRSQFDRVLSKPPRLADLRAALTAVSSKQ